MNYWSTEGYVLKNHVFLSLHGIWLDNNNMCEILQTDFQIQFVKVSFLFIMKSCSHMKQSCAIITQSNTHDIAYSTLVTEAEHAWEFVFTTDTPYLALTGKLWGVYCEEFGEN